MNSALRSGWLPSECIYLAVSSTQLMARASDFKSSPVAAFLVPDWGVKPAMASGCHKGPPSTIGWCDNPTPLTALSPSMGLGIGPLDSVLERGF